MIVEGLWNFGLEKPLSAQSLLSYCGNLEDNAENSADDESLAFKVQREVWESLKGTIRAILYFELRIQELENWLSG